MKQLVIGILVGAVVSAGGASAQVKDHRPFRKEVIKKQRCAEDETFLQGRGDFEDGSYARYICVHPDNL